MLEFGLSLVADLALQRWIARGHEFQGKILPDGQGWLLQFGWRVRTLWLSFALFCSALFFGIPLVVQGLNGWQDWVLVVLGPPLFGACLAGSIYLAWIACVTKVILTKDGIT